MAGKDLLMYKLKRTKLKDNYNYIGWQNIKSLESDPLDWTQLRSPEVNGSSEFYHEKSQSADDTGEYMPF